MWMMFNLVSGMIFLVIEGVIDDPLQFLDGVNLNNMHAQRGEMGIGQLLSIHLAYALLSLIYFNTPI
jgi:hypothetical protein